MRDIDRYRKLLDEPNNKHSLIRCK